MENTLSCNGCKQMLPVESFAKCLSVSRGYQYKCRACHKTINHTEEVKTKKREDIKEWRKKNPEKRAEQKKRSYEKHKEHQRQKSKDWYHTNKDRYRDGAMLRKYGITLEQFNSLREGQNYCCAICGAHESENAQGLVIDHCHEAGNVRKLLCTPCNVGLGMFKDNPELLIKAADYLKEYNGIGLDVATVAA
jgi:hypothetical protein